MTRRRRLVPLAWVIAVAVLCSLAFGPLTDFLRVWCALWNCQE